jgi:hypothetical protein
MARTMSVSDDDTHITASMTIDDQGITELRFSATNGARVTAADLRLVALFGLTLPTEAPPLAVPPPATSPAPMSADVLPVAAATPPAQRTPSDGKARRYSRKRPDDQTLLALWRQHGGATAIGRAVGCHATTVHEWIRGAKTRGVEFPRPGGAR